MHSGSIGPTGDAGTEVVADRYGDGSSDRPRRAATAQGNQGETA